ncbi:MAG: DUF2975 domain-containing protein [Neomegalonema sp.]|nr:DUF2975 domain-containing protein [Neomegalonema sp.]
MAAKMTQKSGRSRVYRLARFGEIIAILGMVVIAGAIAYQLYLMAANDPQIDAPLRAALEPQGIVGVVTPLVRRSAYFLWVLMPLVGLIGLNHTRRLFRGYQRDEIFTPEAANRLSSVGWAVMALSPVATLADTLVVYLYSAAAGDAKGTISIDDTDIFAIVFGLLLVVVGRVFHEAARIAQENKEFV